MRNIRENLITILYQYEFYKDLGTNYLFNDFKSDNEKLVFEYITNNTEKIDSLIDSVLFNYSLSRMSLVDKQIIRIACYELLETNLATGIIINEAINLTKKLTNLDDEKQRKFNNRVLHNLAKRIRSEEWFFLNLFQN